MELGLVWGYWTAQPPQGFVELTQAATWLRLRVDRESWGSTPSPR